jgi:serine/threonine-protein kinase
VLIGLILWGMLRSNTVEVPKVTGATLDSAVSTLNTEGFSVGEVIRVQRDAPMNRVLDQDPVGEADRDCAFFGWFCSDPKVDLTVSAGPGQVEVPDVSGQSRDDAEQALDEAGLGVAVETRPDNDVPVDAVIETDPAAGQSVRRGTQVTLIVSSGPSQVAVPPVVGQTLNAAQQQLSARGLESSSTEQDSDRPKGEVISQSPNAGTRVDPGSTVSLVVSRGPVKPATVNVPNVVGQTRADAVSELRALGLAPDIQEQSTSIQPQDGRVTDQNPGGGSTVNEGTRIVLIVGVYEPPAPTGSGGVQTP